MTARNRGQEQVQSRPGSGWRQAALFWALVAVLAIGKLMMVRQDEIVAAGWDETRFIEIADAGYWARPYGLYTHMRQPGYPLFLEACQATGVPVRVAVEVCWIAACVAASGAARRCGVRWWLAAVGGGLCMFHPWSVHLFSRALADPVYASGLMVFVTAMGAAMAGRGAAVLWTRWIWAVIAVLGAAVAGGMRQEIWMLPGLALGAASVTGVLAWRGAWTRRQWALGALTGAVLPMVAVAGVEGAAARWANRRAIGVAVSYDLVLPGLKSLYHRLLEIPSENSGPRRPAPKDARAKAYAVSPTFATLGEKLESPTEMAWWLETNAQWWPNEQGELGSSLIWAVRDAAWRTRTWTSAAELDRFFQQSADEIGEGMRAGRLEHRWAPLNFVPPDWGKLAASLPASTRQATSVLFQAPAMWEGESGKARADRVEAYNRVLNRRPALVERLRERSPGEPADEHVVQSIEWTIKGWLSAAYGTEIVCAAVIGLAGLATAGYRVWRRRVSADGWAPIALLAIVAGGAASRFALVVMMDSSGIPVQFRYLWPASMFLVFAGAVGLDILLGSARGGTAPKSG